MVIPAAGRGTRMQASGISLPKCLVPVGGARIIDRLVSEVADTVVTEIRVAVPVDDTHIGQWQATRDQEGPPVHLVASEPASMGTTITRLVPSDEEGPVLVVDSDLVLPPAALRFFVESVGTRPWPRAVVGVSAIPWSLGDRTIWWSDSGQPCLGRADRVARPTARLVGLYLFRPDVVRALRDEAAVSETSSFATFLESLAPGDVSSFPFDFAYDCNSVDDVHEAGRALR